jgi:DNA-binding NtrC family response regulator
MAGGDEIPADPGLLAAGAGVAPGASDEPRQTPLPQGVRTLAEIEIAAIDGALAATGGDKTKAAKLLGISRTALYEKLKRRAGGTPTAGGEPVP